MNCNDIFIYGAGTLSPWGLGMAESARSASSGKLCFEQRNERAVGALPKSAEEMVGQLRQSSSAFEELDRTALLAIVASREALKQSGWGGDLPVGVNIGSSRGATALFEESYGSYLTEGRVPPLTSPLTTLGNISSCVAQDLSGSKVAADIVFSHSITCSTALHAIGNAIAWIKSGMSKRFLAGAAEAPLTPFTFAQMDALRIYSPYEATEMPCRPCATQISGNTFVLGEGAAIFAIGNGEERGKPLCKIKGLGFNFEETPSATGMTSTGKAFQRAMAQALDDVTPDLVIMHAAGTKLGDEAELHAVREVCGDVPCTTTKWMIGHSFGASGALGLAYALFLLTDLPPEAPFAQRFRRATNLPNRILINAAGFGGNVACVVIERA